MLRDLADFNLFWKHGSELSVKDGQRELSCSLPASRQMITSKNSLIFRNCWNLHTFFNVKAYLPGPYKIFWGAAIKTAKDLQTEIARLEPWQAISRSPVKTEEFTKFTEEAFYKNY